MQRVGFIPPFLDSHFHLDQINNAGRNFVMGWKPSLKYDDLVERAENLCRWSISGTGSHFETFGVEAMLHVREKFKDLIDIQLVAFPQDGLLRSKGKFK